MKTTLRSEEEKSFAEQELGGYLLFGLAVLGIIIFAWVYMTILDNHRPSSHKEKQKISREDMEEYERSKAQEYLDDLRDKATEGTW